VGRTRRGGSARRPGRHPQGRDLGALPYYEALALFKLGVILEGGHARSVKAGTAENTPTVGAAPRLFKVAAEFARGERV
jgi:hypothetical protein